MHLNGDNLENAINWGEKHVRNRKMDILFLFMKIILPQGGVCPCPGLKTCTLPYVSNTGFFVARRMH